MSQGEGAGEDGVQRAAGRWETAPQTRNVLLRRAAPGQTRQNHLTTYELRTPPTSRKLRSKTQRASSGPSACGGALGPRRQSCLGADFVLFLDR